MPYKVSNGFVYVKKGGRWIKKNKARLPPKKAQAYLRALYANEPEARRRKQRVKK